MEVSFTHEVPFGHRLMNHDGKCRFPHGHNYMISGTMQGPVDPNTGMVVDFSVLKRLIREYLDDFDHAFVLYEGDPLADALREMQFHPTQALLAIPTKVVLLNVHPTAENLAWLIRTHILSLVPHCRARVTVYEQRDCFARADGTFDTVDNVPKIVTVW